MLEIFKSFYKSSHDPPANLTSESHLDLFPKERLVYLSPDSTNELSTLNPDDIYVLGKRAGMKKMDIILTVCNFLAFFGGNIIRPTDQHEDL